ncbi:MAG: pantoate--beta-alanine ligase [Proteobacteria bacterium]|nr:pantoate--beta-alanine ligase [Pseudomonadota bacterium]
MSNSAIEIVRTVADLRTRISAWRAAGDRIGLIPTMGSLHEGHFSLVAASRAVTDRTCATLFVNPKQFGPNEDFETYPRDEKTDAAALGARGADLLYIPDRDEIYPDGFATAVTVAGIGDKLEGVFRPGFFTGVATVVAKLLLQAAPDDAFFGEKDFQQLCVVRRLTQDLNIPVEIHGCAIVREADGLALSSRNAYLSAPERAIAPTLQQALISFRDKLQDGVAVGDAAEQAREIVLAAGFAKIDYLSLYDPTTFEEAGDLTPGARILAAAWLGTTRLIDNIPAQI